MFILRPDNLDMICNNSLTYTVHGENTEHCKFIMALGDNLSQYERDLKPLYFEEYSKILEDFKRYRNCTYCGKRFRPDTLYFYDGKWLCCGSNNPKKKGCCFLSHVSGNNGSILKYPLILFVLKMIEIPLKGTRLRSITYSFSSNKQKLDLIKSYISINTF